MIRVKVCCISSREELRMAVAAGASAVGLVSTMPSGPGVVDDALIRELAGLTPPGVSRFLLTPRKDAAGIVEHVRATGVDVVQICDHVDPSVLREVRERTDARVVAVVHAGFDGAEAYAATAGREAHALLLDSGRPGADFLELGGTGRTHDWDVSARIVRESPVPVWLAGGLKPSNVAVAIATVRPFGVDLCTGVRVDGHLDHGLLTGFFAAVRGAPEH
ncbi:MAG: phosphoribosylanthranilate isomerase [Alphaproteobacteria bacterium]|nr:phosphoribosylanthranilate isomerase [Alphaproteobacteria bacterium]MCB9693997.1 phosphoribosylanthranilate isomerase [Alphaproteobacteria bacterium]